MAPLKQPKGNKRVRRRLAPPVAASSDRPLGVYVAAAVVVLATCVAYANSIHNPFLFDDGLAILGNPTIRSLWPLSAVLSPPAGGSPVQSRPFVNLSFAVNYATGGTNPLGYHLVNIAIHLFAALALMGIVRRTLAETAPCRPLADAATQLSCAVATIWAVHPLTTEPVTYVTQRTESLVGLFFLLTLYAVIRSATSDRPRRWFGLAIAACALGMASKENMVAAPIVALAYDAVFLSGSVRAAWRRRGPLYTGLAATWLMLGYDLLRYGFSRSSSAGFGGAMTVWQYGTTQCWAILHYLRLAFVPHPLVLDYGEWTARSAAEIVPGAVVVTALVVGTLIALARLPWLGFLGLWFFAILAPTSSVLPVPAETVAEKRMYLPLAAVVSAVVILVYLAWRRLDERSTGRQRSWLRPARWLPAAAAASVVCGLIVLTRNRNDTYSNPVTIWRETTNEVPRNERAQYNLGMALVREDRVAEASECFRAAVKLNPWDAAANGNLAEALLQLGRPTEALPYLRTAVGLKPDDDGAQKALVRLLFQMGRSDEAVASAKEFLGRLPDYPPANALYASALARTGHVQEGAQYLERARRLANRARSGAGPGGGR